MVWNHLHNCHFVGTLSLMVMNVCLDMSARLSHHWKQPWVKENVALCHIHGADQLSQIGAII